MNNQKVTLNLTPFFVLWSVAFVGVTLLTGNASWLWWAAAPWIFLLGFMAVLMLVVGVAFAAAWWSGKPIRVTNRDGSTRRIVQRKR